MSQVSAPPVRALGREVELQRLSELVASSVMTGTAVIIEGEAGIGKTTLLRSAAAEAEAAGFRMLKCAGSQNTSLMGYEGLHELLHPLMGYEDSLPDRQRNALMTAFALIEGPVPDRLVVSIAALGLLEEAASRRPIFISVDDAQWLDPSSAAVIAFLGVRLSNAPVLMLATARSGGNEAEFAPAVDRLTLSALLDEDAALLLDATASDLSPSSRSRILRESAGNPLALHELPAALRAHRVEHNIRGSRLPMTRRMEDAFLDQTRGLPGTSRILLLLAAASDDISLPDLMSAAKSIHLSLADLAPLEAAGLLNVSRNNVEFRHPLLRSAVQGAASTDEWIRVQAALAGAVSEPARAAWHRSAATFEHNEGVAQELEDVAIHARNRGAQAEAAAALQRAASLSPEASDKARRLAYAAETARAAGLSAESIELLEGVDPSETDPNTIVQVAMTRLILSLTTGTPCLTREDFEELGRRLTDPKDSEKRLEILWGAAINARGRALPREDWRRIEGELQAISTRNPLKTIALAALAPSESVARLRAELPNLVPRLKDEPLAMLSLAIAAESLQDLETALTCWGLSAERFHEMGSPGDECQALRGRANILLLRGRFTDGLADAEYAYRMAMDTAQPLMASMSAATVARANALLGREKEAQEAILQSYSLSKKAALALVSADARWAAGLIALSQHRYREALIEFTYMTVHPTRALWTIADRTEAAVRSGRSDSVRENVEEAEKAAATYKSSDLMMLVERSKALLGEGTIAAEHFERSIALGLLSETPFELARSRLLYGEWLRRERQSIAAREQLFEALTEFETIGAESFADRAAVELRAAGEAPVRRPVVNSKQRLTPQELQVAQLAAAGMTNKEIADRIYLSHRTVSTHLYKLFPKLGITARMQIREALDSMGYEG